MFDDPGYMIFVILAYAVSALALFLLIVWLRMQRFFQLRELKKLERFKTGRDRSSGARKMEL